jgi:predicted transcriptional regulator of viral defense system
MKNSMIWKKMIVDGKRYATSSEINTMARKLDKDPKRSLSYLQEHDYIVRIIRGIFYVKSPEERERGILDHSIYDIIAEALKIKGVKNWYFGLETGLKLNNMTHEYFTIDYVITNSYRTTKVINIIDSKFQFLKWGGKHFKFGIKKKNIVRFSDREKTVLDMIYRRYVKTRESRYALSPYYDYNKLLDMDRFADYLIYYPTRFKEMMEEVI